MLRIFTLFILGVSFNVLSSSQNSEAVNADKKPSLEFVEMFTNELLIDNYKGQLRKRIFQKYPQYVQHAQDVDYWLDEVFQSGEFETLLAGRYKLIFTEKQFAELVAFYQTETGKKFLKIAPKMSTMSATVAGQFVHKNLPELEAYIEKTKKQQ